jgi:hypothetical protein
VRNTEKAKGRGVVPEVKRVLPITIKTSKGKKPQGRQFEKAQADSNSGETG